ncbi:MAG: hypothetical protein OMM_14359 [Candidatus Magnetoglobus multicellularis str. Araruama]|uniref:Uncharacterized protein n=1 Tax=Candidatus Magnetoglobus multicellularis str. Araruama TaxID=890399 RepID=A0A1V1NS10_9BACT|nr:MAG: hypothetical protein OMM_14359 [Candidatus Magnetoglobus multicellularis str. Araruama]
MKQSKLSVTVTSKLQGQDLLDLLAEMIILGKNEIIKRQGHLLINANLPDSKEKHMMIDELAAIMSTDITVD